VTKLEKQQTGSVLMGLTGFCVFLLLPFPVGIYYVTRAIICIGAIYGAFKVYKYFPERMDMVIFLSVVALIFNPLFPFYFQIRTVWMFMDVIAAIAFYSSAKIFKERVSSVIEESYSSSQNYKPTQTQDTSELEEKITSGRRSDNDYDRDLYTIKISEQIAGVVPLNLNKREQMVLGLIYLFYAIENLAKTHKEEKFANGGTGLFLNTVFIPKNYIVINDYLHSPFFIYEIEQIIKKSCTGKSISTCLSRVRDEAISSVKPYFSYDDFKESGHKFIQDYCRSLNSPELSGYESGFFRLCRDESFTKKVKGELIKILEEADSNYKNKDELKNITDYIHTGKEWVVEEKKETPFIPKGTMQKDSKGMLGKEVIPELTDTDEPPFTSEEPLKPESEDMTRNEVIPELTDTANLDSEKKRGSRKEFKSVLDVAVQYFFEVVKEVYEGNFNVGEANLFRGRFQTENNFKLGLWKITRIESEAISFASHHNEIIISQVFSRGKLQRDHPKVVEVSNYLNSII